MKRYLKHQTNLAIMCIMIQTFFAACTQDDELATVSGDELQISVTATGYASIKPGTRATDAGYATAFADGDQIGVIAVQGGAVVQDNIPYTYNGTTWAPSDEANKAYIPSGTADWLVYYPYSATMDGKKTGQEILDAFTVPADQGTQDKYTVADLMTWSGAVTGNTLTATLAHRLAMVEINLSAGTNNVRLKAGGGTVLPWNISGTTWRCLVKPAAGATLSGAYTQAGGILAWQQANVTLEAGKYTRVNVTNGISDITGYAGNIEIEYKEGGTDNIAAGDIKDHASDGIVKSITLTGKGKTHLIGRVINADNPIHLKFGDSGDLLFRDAVNGFIPIGSYAEFRKISGNAQSNYRLEANLDLMDEEWTPIQDDGTYFNGEFDGAGKEISHLKISQSGNYKGLFSRNRGTIRDVHIVSGTITASSLSGGICGENRSGGQIISCSNAATVGGSSRVGGVVGYNAAGSTVTACYNTGKVEGNDQAFGGVAGSNDGTVTACYNSGAVSGTNRVGGVAGFNANGTVTACYNTGAVEGSGNYVGGVVGYNNFTVTACYWKSGTAPDNGIGTEFSDFFTPSGSDAWNTGTDGTDGYWKAGIDYLSTLPKLWWE